MAGAAPAGASCRDTEPYFPGRTDDWVIDCNVNRNSNAWSYYTVLIQQWLVAESELAPHEVDGVYGQRTAEAVWNYQNTNDVLTEDGKVGRYTWQWITRAWDRRSVPDEVNVLYNMPYRDNRGYDPQILGRYAGPPEFRLWHVNWRGNWRPLGTRRPD